MVALHILEAAPQIPAGSSALVWLGIALVALAASAAAVFWWLRAGAARGGAADRAAASALPMMCPACPRGYSAGTTHCPLDAWQLGATGGHASGEAAATGGNGPP